MLIDTYDTLAAAQALAAKVRQGELEVQAIRLDSGDLVTLSQQVRQLLPNAVIVASGDLDEVELDRLQTAGACIDSYGIGTKLVTGAPVNGVYKLVEVEGQPVMKIASGKLALPGRKQIFRRYDGEQVSGDRLGLATEAPTPAEVPLLQLVMKVGTPTASPEPLAAIAQRTRNAVTQLPAPIRQRQAPASLTVTQSPALQALTAQTQARIRQQ